MLARVLNRAETLGARALASLPSRVKTALAGAPIVVDGCTLAPDVQLILRVRALVAGDIVGRTPKEARRNMRRQTILHEGPPIEVGAVRDLLVDGADGPLRARHYAPAAPGGPHALLVYLHGGGFVVGDLDTHDAPCRFLCKEAGVHVLSVDYRLAPENPFPAGVLDAYAAFLWAHANAHRLGADGARVAIGGDSAGANLSAVVSQLAKENGGPAPALQLLLYPGTDRSMDHPSMAKFAEGFLLTRAEIRWFLLQYTGNDPALNVDPRVSPLLGKDLAGLAPALVFTAAFDPLRDEGEAYAEAMRAAGTRVAARRFDGLVHGFVNMVALSPTSASALREVAGALVW